MDGLPHIGSHGVAAASGQPLAVVLCGLNESPRLQAFITNSDVGVRSVLRLEPECAPPCPATVWRLETGWGSALNAEGALHEAWQRPPFALTVRLAQYAPGTVVPTVLDEGTIGTRVDWPDYVDRVERLALHMVRDTIAGRQRGPASIEAATRPTRSGPPAWLRHQAARWKARLMDEWWSLGCSRSPLGDLLQDGELRDITWFEPNAGRRYLADPFPWPGTGRILCEDMPRDGGPGIIVAVEQDGPRLVNRVPILADGLHHSYPATFQDNGKIYCIPESVARGATYLYDLGRDGQLGLVCPVAPDRRLADPTLFRSNDKYWIACTDLDIGRADNLCLLYASDVAGPWLEHAKWPVRIDIRGARPAGAVIHHEGRVIRPGQDCAATYGAAIALHAVEVLTPDDYREILLTVLRPDPAGPFPDGVHTLAHDGEKFWLDGKRFVFDGQVMIRKLVHRLRNSTLPAGT